MADPDTYKLRGLVGDHVCAAPGAWTLGGGERGGHRRAARRPRRTVSSTSGGAAGAGSHPRCEGQLQGSVGQAQDAAYRGLGVERVREAKA